jgi:hypothetical protein
MLTWLNYIHSIICQYGETGYTPPEIAFPKIRISGFTSGLFSHPLQEQFPQVANNLPIFETFLFVLHLQ